jgi:hypothetical protein
MTLFGFTSLSLLQLPLSAGYSTAEHSNLLRLNYDWTVLGLSVSLMLLPTVSRPVCLGIKHPSGAYDQTFITVRQLRICCLQLPLALASAFILRSESRRTHDHILLSQIRDSPNLEPRSPYLYPPGTGWPNYIPRHWVPFPSPFTTRRATVEVIRTLLRTLEVQPAIP